MAFEITIEIDHDLKKSTVRASGEDRHVITDEERRSFGIDDASLKRAVALSFGKTPNDVFVRSPTPWGDLYKTYNWEQVTVHVRPVSAQITSISANPQILKRQKFKNNSSIPGFFDVAISTDVSDTVEANWTETADVSVSQSVHYGVEFFGGETSITFSLGFQRGGSQSRTVSIGQTSGVQVELQPGQAVQALLSANLGRIGVRVEFEAYLSGIAAVNYNPAYRDHHFWAMSINGLRQALGLQQRLRMIEDISVGVYSDGDITLEDLAGNPAMKLTTGLVRESLRDRFGGLLASGVPTMNHIFDNAQQAKGTAGHDTQNRRNKDADSPNGKGTAGQDAQSRRNRLEGDDAPSGKGTAGQDAQGRRNRFDDEDDAQYKKGTAGQDAQSRRNKLEGDDAPSGKGTAGQDAQGRRNRLDDEDDAQYKKGTAGQDAQSRRNKLEGDDAPSGKGTAGQDAQGRRN